MELIYVEILEIIDNIIRVMQLVIIMLATWIGIINGIIYLTTSDEREKEYRLNKVKRAALIGAFLCFILWLVSLIYNGFPVVQKIFH